MPGHTGTPSRRAATALVPGLLGAVLLLAPVAARAAPPEGPFRPEAHALFANCTPQDAGPTGRAYVCLRFSATLAWLPVSTELSERNLLEHVRTGVATVLQGESTFEPARLKLAGREREALRVTVREASGKPIQHVGHLTVEKADDGAWMYFCVGRPKPAGNEQECGKVLEFFATTGSPEPIDLKTVPKVEKPVLFSRELVIPEGCQLAPSTPQVGRIQCPNSFLTWTLVTPAPDVNKWLQESVAVMRNQLKVAVSEQRVECTIGPSAGTCVQLASTGPGQRLRMSLGVSRQGPRAVQVSCGLIGEGAMPPPVCNGMLEALPAPTPEPARPSADAGK